VAGAAAGLTVCLLAVSPTATGQQAARDVGPIALRFHHIHYRVADPGAALGEAAAQLGGTRVIAPGLGVGVRIGREYVLLDRAVGSAAPVRREVKPADAYAEAATWLRARGIPVQPATFAETSVVRPLPDAFFDHLGFATDDPRTAIASIEDTPLSVSDDVARFRLPSGVVLEIVRDTDRPDAFWCPMHPDVRSPGPGKCALCAMSLVPIPPPRIGEYRLDVTLTAQASGKGVSAMRFVVRDPETGEPVSRFIEVHERLFHLFVVSRDLGQFVHAHPERRDDGSFEVHQALDPGEYLLVADFLPVGGTPQVLHRVIETPGYAGPLFSPPTDLKPGPLEQEADGLRIRLEPPSPAPLRETRLRFVVMDSAGAPVTDLEPFLGAAGHLLIVNPDLTAAIHGHPEGARSSGPIVTFGPIFPSPGVYKMWVQFQRKGRVMTAPFVIEVPSP
jgi:hypothetical protein